jgi:glycosyltransferase involved in cell wall biosynthesis
MESNTAGPEAQPYPGETSHSSHVTRHSPISLVLVGEGPLRADLERQAQELGLLVVDRDNSSPVAAVSDRRSSATGATDAEYCKLNTDHPVEQHGTVLFYGFQQSDTTPVFFALCEAFILPSLYEEWGLVVNEAMACGAPVIVSRNVGSARDLVEGTSVAPVSPPAGSAVIGGEDTAAAEGRVPLEERPGFTFDPHNVDELAKLLERFATDPTLKEKLGAAGRGIIRSWTPERFGQSGLKAFEAALAV